MKPDTPRNLLLASLLCLAVGCDGEVSPGSDGGSPGSDAGPMETDGGAPTDAGSDFDGSAPPPEDGGPLFDAGPTPVDGGPPPGTDGGPGIDAGGPIGTSYVPQRVLHLGGTRQDNLRDVVVAPDGDLILVGGTFLNGGRHDLVPAGVPHEAVRGTCSGASSDTGADMDIFVIRLDTSGTVEWITTIGGPHYERAYGVEIAPDGDIVLAGRAGDCAPTTAGAVQRSFGGDTMAGAYGQQDGYVVRLAPSGTVRWATYLGGDDNAFIRDMDVDSRGDVVVGTFVRAGTTLPGWAGRAFDTAFQSSHPGGVDTLAIKLAGDGTAIRWASRLGGSLNDGTQPTIRVDPTDDSVVIYDHGRSTDANANAPASQRFGAYPAGGTVNHGLLTRLRVDGAHVFTRHLGASGPVNGDTHNLWVHTDGTIYTADSLCRDSGCFSAAGDAPGALSTLDPATTAASAQRDYAGGGYPSGNPILGNYPGDGYIVHLSQDGATVLGATLFGGPRGEGIEGVSVTGHGSVVVTGGTNSSSLPAVTTGAYSGGLDMFVAVLSPDLTEVRYVRYLGSDQDQSFTSVVASGDLVAAVGVTGAAGTLHNSFNPATSPAARLTNADLAGTTVSPSFGPLGGEDGVLYVFEERTMP